jgi:hypothetical protein
MAEIILIKTEIATTLRLRIFLYFTEKDSFFFTWQKSYSAWQEYHSNLMFKVSFPPYRTWKHGVFYMTWMTTKLRFRIALYMTGKPVSFAWLQSCSAWQWWLLTWDSGLLSTWKTRTASFAWQRKIMQCMTWLIVKLSFRGWIAPLHNRREQFLLHDSNHSGHDMKSN